MIGATASGYDVSHLHHAMDAEGSDPGLAGFVAPLLLTEIQPERTMDEMYHVGNKICDCGPF